MTDKTPSGARCSQPSLALVCWSLPHSWTGWDFCTDMWVWIFHADFLVWIFGCGPLGAVFFRRFWGADFFADFVMACADFGIRIFCRFCWPSSCRKKNLKKSHQKNQPQDPHQRSSPRSVSSQYTTTLLLARHSKSPQGVWVQMPLVENRFFFATGFCQGGWTCNLNMCLLLMSRMTRRQNGPAILKEFFSWEGRYMPWQDALQDTQTPKQYSLGQHFPKTSSLGIFVAKRQERKRASVTLLALSGDGSLSSTPIRRHDRR